MRLLQIITFLLLTNLSILSATELLKIDGEVVNPACIKLMQPWLSENTDSPVIIRSVVLDTCQNSNLAYDGQKPTISDDKKVSFYKDPNDGHSYFGYTYLGKTSKGKNYIYHNGTIGVYTITKENMITDLQKNTSKRVTVINKLGDSFVPCFRSASIKDDTLVIKVKKYDPSKPTAFQCGDRIETLIIE